MSRASIDFLNLFVRSPGELLYFAAIIAISIATLFMVLGQRLRYPQDRLIRKYSVALAGIVFSWLLLMAGAVAVLVMDREAVLVMPPLERLAVTVTLLMLSWAFIDTEPRRWGSIPGLLLSLLVVSALAGYANTAIRWAEVAGEVDYNVSVFGVSWTFAALTICAVGMLLTISYFRSIADSSLKFVFFFVLLLGFGGTLLQIAQGNIIGNYAGPVRLAFVTAMMITPVIVYRLIVNRLESDIERLHLKAAADLKPAVKFTRPDSEIAASPAPVERESVQLLRALGMILEDATSSSVPDKIVKAVIDVLKVEVAGLLRMQDANYADFAIVYDNVMRRYVSGMALNLDNQPTLATAIDRRAQRNLTIEQNREELRDLYTRLDIDQIGPVYIQPLVHDRELVAVLLVASPYSGRNLLSSEEDLLKGVGAIAAGLLALSYAASDAQMLAEERTIQAIVSGVPASQFDDNKLIAERQEAQSSLALARDQIAELGRQVMQLKLALDEARAQMAASLVGENDLTASQQINTLNDERQRLRDERDELLTRLQEAETALSGAAAGDREAMVNNMIEALQREKEDLLSQREWLQTQLDKLGKPASGEFPQTIQGLIDQMEEEKSLLEDERNHLRDKLLLIQSQLQSLGIEEGRSGLAQLISKLYEQYAELQEKHTLLQTEMERLRSERSRLDEAIQLEELRVLRINTLEKEVNNLASDREALTKQRDRLRAERDEVAERMDIIKQHRARLLAQAAGYEMQLKEAHEEQAKLGEEIQKLADERSDLVNLRDRLTADLHAVTTERDQLIARMEGDRDRIQQVGEEGVGQLTAMIEELTEQRNMLEHELNQTKLTLSSVQNELQALTVRVGTPDVEAKYRPNNPEELIGLVQELRTPMTSISANVETLLGESTGILGELQRRLLQRVHTNTTRLGAMLTDLIKMTELDTGHFTLTSSQVKIDDLIYSAINSAAMQLREKGLAVNLNLDSEIPPLQGDPAAIGQIIGQLLTNAYLVSPPETEISIRAHRCEVAIPGLDGAESEPVDAVCVSIEDRGGGIEPEDRERVFARKYKADNPLIQGLGDTGIGLSLAKALVEAHGGRISVDIRENLGTIFTFALPLNTNLQPQG